MMDRNQTERTGESSGTSGVTGHGYDRRPTSDVSDTGVNSTTYSPHGDMGSETEASASSSSGSVKDRATDMAGTARDKVSDVTSTARDKVSSATDTARGAMGSATETVNQQRDTVAGSLDTVATTLRDNAETIPGGERTTQIAQTAAEKIETASGYLREHEVSDMMSDVEGFVRTHPTESLVIALAAGFLLGRTIRS
jgi:ElaB/YqjD/DUF883 family membrane-anchored ribosome-binding protein